MDKETQQKFDEMQKTIESLTKQVEALAPVAKQVEMLSEWKAARELQQLMDPLDDVSKNLLGAWTGEAVATGFTLTRNINLSGDPQTISVAKTPDGLRLVDIGGALFYIPYFTP